MAAEQDRVRLPFAERRGRFALALQRRGLDGAMVSQSTDLYYLCGSIQQAQLYVSASGSSVLFVRRSFARAQREADVDLIEHLPGFSKLGQTLSGAGIAPPQRLGLELDVLPYQTAARIQEALSGVVIEDIGMELRLQRAVKDQAEIAALERAGRVWQAPFKKLQGMVGSVVGRDEFDVGAAMISAQVLAGQHGAIRLRGFNSELFMGGLLSGPHGAVAAYFDGPTTGPGPHPVVGQGAGYRRIGRGEPILADFAATHEGYICDGTRTFATGTLPDSLKRAHDLARAILRRAEALVQPGAQIAPVFQAALAMAEEAGLLSNFMGFGDDRVQFLGHGVGLELDELPVLIAKSDGRLHAGNVVAIEPKFVFPGLGAVGVENTYVIEEGGPRSICDFPEEIVWL